MHAQSGFIFRYSTPNDEIPNSVIETADSGFIIAAGIKTPTFGYQTLFIRLNKNGDTLSTKTLIFPGGISGLGNLIKLDNGSYLGIGGKVLSSGTFKLWLLNFTDTFTIIKDTSYFINLESMFTYYGFFDHSANLIIYGSLSLTSTSAYHPFIFTSNQTLDSLGYKFFDVSTSQEAYSMIEKPDTTGYLMMISGTYLVNTSSPSQILTMDYSFNVNNIDSLPGKLGWYLNSKSINKHDIIITGQRWYEGSIPQMEKIGILKLNSSFSVKDKFYLGPEDTISYPGIYSNLDFTDTNNIFCIGTANVNISNVYSTIPSYILIGKFNSSLNLTWQKYYGGDQYYLVTCVRAVKDGGVIIGATSFNYQRQNHERDIFIIKIDSNGLITGIHQPPTNNVNKTLVYPNPGQDLLNIETQQENLVFHLVDLMGREICNKNLIPGKNVMQVQDLNAGIYIYKVARNSQMMECGKWIKE
jgi:hypothetical protein